MKKNSASAIVPEARFRKSVLYSIVGIVGFILTIIVATVIFKVITDKKQRQRQSQSILTSIETEVEEPVRVTAQFNVSL